MLNWSHLTGGSLLIAFVGLLVASCSSDDAARAADNDADAGVDAGPNGATDAGSEAGGGRDWGPKMSGSRIAVREIHAADGSKVFSGLFDRKLGVTCSLSPTDDGKLRCLPDTQNVVVHYFQDDRCTQRMATRIRDFCPLSGYARERSCDSVRIYRAQPTVPQKVYQFNGADTCVGTNPSDYTDYLLAEKIEPTEFVSFTRVSESLGSGISARKLLGEDGTKTSDGQLFDDARGKPCRAKLADDGTTRCVPDTKSQEDRDDIVELWADACVNRLAGRSCVPTSVELDDTVVSVPPTVPSAACDRPEQANIAARGASMQDTTAYRCFVPCNPETCTATTALATDSRIEGVLAPSTFPPVTVEVRSVGGTRLKAMTTVVGGTEVSTERLRDPDFGRCTFQTAADGTLRCLPDNYRIEFWLDSACSAKPIATGDTTCEAPKYVTLASANWCQPTTTGKVYALSAPMSTTGLTYYTKDELSGACFKVDDTVRNPPSVVYPLGDEVPPSTFVEGTLVEW